MAVHPIVRLGHPALRTPAEPLDPERIAEPEIQTLIDDMFETMLEAGGVGLAAPQIDREVQLFVYLALDPAADESVEPERRVAINPMVEPLSGELVYDWEGCLSIPDLRGLVPRHPTVRIHALDRHGKGTRHVVEGYAGRIVQHEFDHLNGIVFLDRMRDLRSLAFGAEWDDYMVSDAGDSAAVG